MCILLPPVVTGGAAVSLCDYMRERFRLAYSTKRARINNILVYTYFIRCLYRSDGSEVAPTTTHTVGSSSGGLMIIGRSPAGCSLVSTQSMRPAVVCLIVCLNDVYILAAVVIAIIGFAVIWLV